MDIVLLLQVVSPFILTFVILSLAFQALGECAAKHIKKLYHYIVDGPDSKSE